jgi:hypothetical protein
VFRLLVSLPQIEDHHHVEDHIVRKPWARAQETVQASVATLPLPFLSKRWTSVIACPRVNGPCILTPSTNTHLESLFGVRGILFHERSHFHFTTRLAPKHGLLSPTLYHDTVRWGA